MSLATSFDWFGLNFLRWLAMVNLEFHFFYIKLIKFQNFVEVFVEYTQFFFIFQRIF